MALPALQPLPQDLIGLGDAAVGLGHLGLGIRQSGLRGGQVSREGGVLGREGGVLGREGGVFRRQGGVFGLQGGAAGKQRVDLRRLFIGTVRDLAERHHQKNQADDNDAGQDDPSCLRLARGFLVAHRGSLLFMLPAYVGFANGTCI